MITSLGALVEGKLTRIDDSWALIPEKDPPIFVDGVLRGLENKTIRFIVTDLDALEELIKKGYQQGQEQKFVEGLQLKDWVNND
jgi:hypothetical protein